MKLARQITMETSRNTIKLAEQKKQVTIQWKQAATQQD